MSGSKHFDRIAVIVTASMLVLTILFMNGAALGIQAAAHSMGYENRLFDTTKVHTIDIVMDDWDNLIDQAATEEYYAANVIIDGESCKNVGIRAKGNTSLSTVAALGSERYSFKIEFDHYDRAKSYHGLDKLSLNNLIQDSTMMKDYLTYTMMNGFGVNSSLCSYAYITVNGEDWGLYLAVEGVEDSFLERKYGSDYGKLYKPDSMSFGGGRGNGGDFDMRDFDFNSTGGDPSGANAFEPSAMFGGNGENGRGGFGMVSGDVKLQYIDDELSSYSNIWNNAKTDITEADQNRLIASLKKLSSYEDIESVVDAEQVIRYFVVHNYVCNGDSYTGSMVHNYYLYEKEGKLAMIPWDYNLAFGTFSGGDATATVNTPIDTPVSGGSSDRPMLNWIFESVEFTQLYHRYFSEFLSSVEIEGIIDNTYNLIKDYVEKDPTAFYSYDEFELGVETIRRFCELRSESISMQLENSETTSDMNYVDASGLVLSDMGSMGGGMGESGADRPGMPDGFDAPSPPDGFDPSNMQGGIGGNFPGQFPGNENGSNRPSGGNMQIPGGDSSFDMNGSSAPASSLNAWAWIAMSIVVLAIGLIIAKLYKH